VRLGGWLSGSALAASAKQIDVSVDEVIAKFDKEVNNGKALRTPREALGSPEGGIYYRVDRPVSEKERALMHPRKGALAHFT
jgi:hypothetical protein